MGTTSSLTTASSFTQYERKLAQSDVVVEARASVSKCLSAAAELVVLMMPPEQKKCILLQEAGCPAPQCDRRRLAAKLPARRLSGATKAPGAYASILYKSTSASDTANVEFALSFMGTKFDEPEMLYYSVLKEPAYFEWAGKSVVTTDGYIQLMAQLLPCIDGVVADLDGDGYSLSHVTGHSLGGAAATIYEALYDTGGLVTFGAPPTGLPDYDPAKTFLKGEFKIKINDYETYNYKSLSLVDTGEELEIVIGGDAEGPSNPEGAV